MQSANGGHDGRYLPSSMDYTGMSHHPHHPHHHLSGGTDPHSGLHYSLPPSAMSAGGHLPHHQQGSKRLQDMDMMGGNGGGNVSSDEDGSMDIKPSLSERGTGRGAPLKSGSEGPPTGKKTKGRVKIKMEFIDNKLRRYTTFSKRKTGIMKKAYELSTLTGTQVMLLVASETGHVYTFATRKLQPMITSDAGKALIQTCLNSPDPPPTVSTSDQRMSVSGYEETELTYNVADSDQQEKVLSSIPEGVESGDEDDGEEEEEIEVEMDDDEDNNVAQQQQQQQQQQLHRHHQQLKQQREQIQRHQQHQIQKQQKQQEQQKQLILQQQQQHQQHQKQQQQRQAETNWNQGKRKLPQPESGQREKSKKYPPPSSTATSSPIPSSSEVLTIRSNHPAFLPPEVISQLLASGHHTADQTESSNFFRAINPSLGSGDFLPPPSITITTSRSSRGSGSKNKDPSKPGSN